MTKPDPRALARARSNDAARHRLGIERERIVAKALHIARTYTDGSVLACMVAYTAMLQRAATLKELAAIDALVSAQLLELERANSTLH